MTWGACSRLRGHTQVQAGGCKQQVPSAPAGTAASAPCAWADASCAFRASNHSRVTWGRPATLRLRLYLGRTR